MKDTYKIKIESDENGHPVRMLINDSGRWRKANLIEVSEVLKRLEEEKAKNEKEKENDLE